MNRRVLGRRLRRSFLVLTSFSSIVAITLGLVVAGALALRYVEKPLLLRIAAGPPRSGDSGFAEAVQRLLPKGIGLRRIEVIRTESPSASASALDEGRADLAIVRSDGTMPKYGGTVLIVHKDAAILAARAGTKVAKVADLKGKRLGIVPDTPANAALLDTILTHAAVLPASVQRVPLQPGQIKEAVEKKLVDAIFFVGPLGDPLGDEVLSALSQGAKTAPAFIGIVEAEAIARRQPGLEKIDVPAGLFRGSPSSPAEDVSTLAVAHHLVASYDLSEATVTALTKRIFTMRAALAAETRIAEYMEAADTEKGGRYPLHAGAAAYYGDNEKSFMDRYGDWIYILAMILGGLGSAVATLLSSIQARSRLAAMAVVDELIKLERNAREAPSLAALKECEDIVEEAALRALQRARENRFDEAGLETVRLAINEARHAIRKRERELERADSSGGPVRLLPQRRPEPSA